MRIDPTGNISLELNGQPLPVRDYQGNQADGQIPPPLVGQLKPGGRMVIPVGAPFALQHLVLVEVDDERKIKTRQLLPVRFVALASRN